MNNNLYRSNNIVLDYATHRMGPVREIFNLAKTKYERRKGILLKKKKKNKKAYTIISEAVTIQIDDKLKMQNVMKGALDAANSFDTATENGQYLDFAKELFEHGTTAIKHIYPGLKSNFTPTHQDDFLLAFITIGNF